MDVTDDGSWISTHGVLRSNGRACLRILADVVAEAVPQSEPPVLSQVKSVMWKRGDDVWVRCFTDKPLQIALEVRALDDVPARSLADELGWCVFDTTYSMSEKLALRSSVGLDPSGHMRLIVKSPDELSRARRPMVEVLRRCWHTLSPRFGPV